MKSVMKMTTLLLGTAMALSGCSFIMVRNGKGPSGDTGLPGPDGKDGQNGSNAYQQYISEHPDYSADEKQWMDDLVNGRLADCKYLDGFALTKGIDAKYAILGYFGGYKEKIILPSVYKKIEISTILPEAFENCSIGELVFSESLKTIERRAFRYAHIEKIVMSKVVTIAEEAFWNSAIGNIQFGDCLTYIGRSAFSGANIRDVVLPPTVTYIGDEAFWSSTIETFKMDSCDPDIFFGEAVFNETKSLISAVLPDQLTSLPFFSFHNSSIKSVRLPAELVEIGENCFSSTSLSNIALNSKLESIGPNAFASTKLTSITIPSNVSLVQSGTFVDCEMLVSVTFDDGVDKEIASYSFLNCYMLREVYLPASVKTIGYAAFDRCTGGTIYCTADSKPSGWNANWLGERSYMEVLWGRIK